MEILEIKNVSFTYPMEKKKAINNISLSITEGEFVCFCGPSGCGKTTLLRLLKDELSPTGQLEGDINYANNLTSMDIGFVMQKPENQIVTDKVWHELAFGLENLGIEKSIIRRRVGEMANYFGIQQWFHQNTYELSGGQKQLLNLASVMVMMPKILILDEPTSQLDPIASREFITTLHRLNEELGITILLCEHRLEEVFPISSKVVVLDEGQLIAMDNARNIVNKLEQFKKKNRLIKSFPSAMQIYYGLNKGGLCPITVNEGKQYLKEQITSSFNLCNTIEVREEHPTAIELKNVWFRYDVKSQDILKRVNLKVEKGEIISILGGNGSGKTTLLNVISGSSRMYQGSIKIFDHKFTNLRKKKENRDKIVLLPQNPELMFIKQTLEEDFNEINRVIKLDKDIFKAKVYSIVKKFNIEHLLKRHPYDLSGGEQQKAALAKLLLLEPKIVLLDEPTKGMDAYSKIVLAELLKHLSEEDITFVIVTHDVEFAANVSHRCGLFFDGCILSMDKPEKFFSTNNFYTTAANRIARDFFPEVITNEQVIRFCLLQNGGDK